MTTGKPAQPDVPSATGSAKHQPHRRLVPAQPISQRTLGGMLLLAALLGGCASLPPRGTGDLGVVIERAAGQVQIVENSNDTSLGTVTGLGDLSHAHVVFSRDARYAYVFGRDGGLSKVDLLTRKLDKRIVQAGNSIGGSISQDGRLIVAQNYDPGGIKVFDADTLTLQADIPATYGSQGQRSKVVGLADLPGNRFGMALFDAGEIWIVDLNNPTRPGIQKYSGIGSQPYDGLASSDGRYYLAGLFGEDGIALLDCGIRMPASSGFSPATAKARKNCRCTRCRTCAAGRSPAVWLSCPPSVGTKSCWPTYATGRKRAGLRCMASQCS